MRDIEPVSEYGTIHLGDVDRAVDDLVGLYAAADLYARYADAARESGHTPAHPVAFGQEMSRRGFRRTRKAVGGGRQVAAWSVGWVNGGHWSVPPPRPPMTPGSAPTTP